ncbi:hypothetical protein [Cytobacillus oceanisediminis]|uniref:hypothetical protein n=1 Tax=Cytobacillus oceanisediminis TaxID=665099 RepID=UPI00207AAE4A|nr:hypothetical protein [Cytobacillus oceanisediminis]USK42278.1 hypothetical protein LIT27_16735 [Cytobacillus oceanisediminis]
MTRQHDKFARAKMRAQLKSSCKTCGCAASTCNCNFKKPVTTSPLTSDCVVVNSVVCSKTVQKVAEVTLPLALFAAGLTVEDIIGVRVDPNLTGATVNARLINDKVVNIGLIPATITITALGIEVPLLTTSIPFQAHTDCPGACPEDLLQEGPLQVEGIFVQPGVPVLGLGGLTLVEGILIKIILRTNITVTRQLIKNQHGELCDANPNRCTVIGTPPTFVFPAPPNGGLLGGGGGGGFPTPAP